MDSNDIERERGITILAKNTSVKYGNYKINIVDTPGHADFGGEVERILKMVNGVVLLVDAYEGTMPQTRFVLQKALELGHPVIIVVNKIDRPDARVKEVVDEVLELLLELNATEEQLDSPIVYCSARNGTASLDPDVQGENLIPLFEKIVRHIPAPAGNIDGPVQMLVSALDYSDFVGSIGIGRIERGTLKQNQPVVLVNYHNPEQSIKAKVTNIYQFEGLNRVAVESAIVGDIVCVSGVEGVRSRGNRVPQDFRAQRGDDLLGQRLAVRRQRGQVRHLKTPEGKTLQRADKRRQPARVRHRLVRVVYSVRQGRNAPVHSHRKHAQRRL